MDDGNVRLVVAAATYFLAEHLAYAETKDDKRSRKKRVLKVKRRTLETAFPAEVSSIDLTKRGGVLGLIPGGLGRAEALPLIIDISFCDPFAPYELKYKDRDFSDALSVLAEKMGLSEGDVDAIEKTKKSAFKAHKHIAWTKIALYTVGGGVVLALGGWLAAPAIGAAIGGGAGLAGAAATAHGLAILGGGSLAMGGAGMAGGMALVAGAGGVAGGALMGGGSLLLQLGAANAKVELVKLQTTFKLALLASQTQTKKAQEVIKSLTAQKSDIEKELSRERDLNDKGASRIKNLEATVQALEDALSWIEKEKMG